MSGHKRVIQIRGERAGAPLFEQLCADLAAALRAWMGGESAHLDGWPTVEWNAENRSLSCTHWSSPRPDGPRFLALRLTQQEGARLWTAHIKVAAPSPSEVAVLDECFVTPPSVFQCVQEPWDLLRFLDGYACRDLDEMQAGKVYAVDPARGTALAQFIQAPVARRALPVVVLSAPRVVGGAYIVPPGELAAALRGMAHVVRLNNRTFWPANAIPIAHRCFAGAARVYWPGYADSDSAVMHRFWQMDGAARANPAATLAEIVAYVCERTLRLEWDASTVERVEQSRIEEEARRRADATAEELVAEAGDRIDQLLADVAYYQARYDEAIRENADLKKTIAALRWQINTQWVVADEPSGELAPAPQVLLSAEAFAALEKMDDGVRRAVETQVLSKLLDRQLRESQSDKVDSTGVTAFVYPRSRSGDGKRAIFSLDGDAVYVHHLFAHHDDYVRQLDAGFCCTQAGQFFPWQWAMEDALA